MLDVYITYALFKHYSNTNQRIIQHLSNVKLKWVGLALCIIQVLFSSGQTRLKLVKELHPNNPLQ